MKLSRFAKIYLTLPVLLLATSAFADTPPNGSVAIADMRYSGTGCEEGTVASNISDDQQALTVLFDSFFVESSAGNMSKDCRIDLSLAVPPGWTYGLFCADVRGYASLDAGVRGEQDVRYSFGRGDQVQVNDMARAGPFEDDYSHLTQIPLSTVVWAPCGESLQLPLRLQTKVSIRGAGANREGYMAVDSVDGHLKQHYGITWKRCETIPRIALEADFVDNCSHLDISYDGMPLVDSAKGNWITIAEVNNPNHVHTYRFRYLPRGARGNLRLSTRGLQPGRQYEVRAHTDWDGTRSFEIKDRQTFEVTEGTCVNPTMNVFGRDFSRGDLIEVEYSDFASSQSNWATLAKSNDPPHKYEKFIWLNGSEGLTDLPTEGLARGEYEIRLFENWAGTKEYFVYDRKPIRLH